MNHNPTPNPAPCPEGKTPITIGLVGNPNCGKTTLFNALTGARQKVGNWPGVTVEKKSGVFVAQERKVTVVDLPGIYSLDVIGDVSLDEMVARDYVLTHEAGLIVNIVDASNLERNLYLTVQLLEMRVPLILALNMADVAKAKGMEIDLKALEKTLGCPVIPLIAVKNEGVEALKNYVANTAGFSIPPTLPAYPEAIQAAVRALESKIPPAPSSPIDPSWLALKILEGDESAKKFSKNLDTALLENLRQELETTLEDDLDIVTADTRYAFIRQITEASIAHHEALARRTWSDRIDRVVLNRMLGIPFFLFMMYLMFMFTINLGNVFVDFFDGFAKALFVDGLGHLLASMGAPVWLETILAKGIGGGIQTVASFIPIIGFLFIFLSILEDSGYMARAAFVMDRFMRFIGLPGKSFVPLIIGFGCNVPAVMASRTLEGERDRLMTIAMTPFMSCGARLPIYALFAVAFFPEKGQNMVFLLYLMGIGAAVLTGLALKRTLLPGHNTPFIMELPPYHLPTLKGVLLHTWNRLHGFVVKAGKIIVPMVLVLNFLNAIGTDGSFGHEDTEDSVLASIGKQITPAFAPIGLHEDNWPAAVGIFTGILAKEAVVGTLNALYSAQGAEEPEEGEEAFSLWNDIKEAGATIPKNFQELSKRLLDPLNLSLAEASDLEAAAEAQEVNVGTFNAMHRLFVDTSSALAYQVLVLLYFPCVAVLGAVRQEVGLRWAFFMAAWSTGLGFGASVLCYQFLTFFAHPFDSLIWGFIILTGFAAAFFAMKYYGHRRLVRLHHPAGAPA